VTHPTAPPTCPTFDSPGCVHPPAEPPRSFSPLPGRYGVYYSYSPLPTHPPQVDGERVIYLVMGEATVDLLIQASRAGLDLGARCVAARFTASGRVEAADLIWDGPIRRPLTLQDMTLRVWVELMGIALEAFRTATGDARWMWTEAVGGIDPPLCDSTLLDLEDLDMPDQRGMCGERWSMFPLTCEEIE